MKKECSDCGRGFTCQSEDIAECWCNRYPALTRPEPGKDCICAHCLHRSSQSAVDQYVQEVARGERENGAQRYMKRGGQLIEGLDYYLDGSLWVLTAWFHLKRGYCCGNACRHCPYGHVNVPK